MKPAITVTDIHKAFKGMDREAVDGLSFQINEGEIYGLLGPNGAGKSTTVNLICGLLHADSGVIDVFGRNAFSESKKVRAIIGVATQDIALFPTLTAFENLEYLMRMYGLKPDVNHINQLLERFGLHSKRHNTVNSFSGGMKRRLNLIASVLHQPKLLILDEPTSGVDVQSRTLILDYLIEENRKGMTILYTSHILEEAERVCHRVGIVDHGKMMKEGTIADLENEFKFKKLEEVFLAITGRSIRD